MMAHSKQSNDDAEFLHKLKEHLNDHQLKFSEEKKGKSTLIHVERKLNSQDDNDKKWNREESTD